jgi:hypothetical protein
MPPVIAVRGLADLQAALKHADRQTRLGIRGELRQVAEPVRMGAEQLAMETIRNMPRSPRWSKMRIGVTRNLIYVAPRQRGVKTAGRNPARRGHRFADLLMDRAMQPSLDRHAHEIETRFENLIDKAADDFNHGGAV